MINSSLNFKTILLLIFSSSKILIISLKWPLIKIRLKENLLNSKSKLLILPKDLRSKKNSGNILASALQNNPIKFHDFHMLKLCVPKSFKLFQLNFMKNLTPILKFSNICQIELKKKFWHIT